MEIIEIICKRCGNTIKSKVFSDSYYCDACQEYTQSVIHELRFKELNEKLGFLKNSAEKTKTHPP